MGNIFKVLVIVYIVVLYMVVFISKKGLYTSLGACFGVVFGVMNHNVSSGLFYGQAIGATIDIIKYIYNKRKKKMINKQS